MISDKREILLIENQQFQFDIIIDHLKKEQEYQYEVFPTKDKDKDKDNFVTFIDNVRVWVNEQYKDNYRATALKFIKDFITDNSIELIIMDHILGGAYHCLTGINLATAINKDKESDNWIPVLFLSKTEDNQEKRIKDYEIYKQTYTVNTFTKWVHKGYFGNEILKEDYFTAIVLPEIKKLLGKSCLEQLNEILEKKNPSLDDPADNLIDSPKRNLNNSILKLKVKLNTFSHDKCVKIKRQISETNDGNLQSVLDNILNGDAK